MEEGSSRADGSVGGQGLQVTHSSSDSTGDTSLLGLGSLLGEEAEGGKD